MNISNKRAKRPYWCRVLFKGWTPEEMWFLFLAGARDFPLLHNIQTCSEAHLAFCSVGTKSCFCGGNADHLPPPSVKANTWCHTSNFHMPSWPAKGQFYLLFVPFISVRSISVLWSCVWSYCPWCIYIVCIWQCDVNCIYKICLCSTPKFKPIRMRLQQLC